ncbi:hypothetical protein [Nonomuraea sp. SBT364]|uniref:hypothetical protein n=1 Tax=Nonomuraea sp. SBT364 TaxID=1580530 RepID=UPI00066DDAF9|nr:hypothetical protein [Nonomuraea sp. SBT364]
MRRPWPIALLAGLLAGVALAGAALFVLRGGLSPAPVHRVPPATVDQVRAIGVVRAEGSYASSEDISGGDSTSIVHTLVLDVASARAGQTIDRTAGLLTGRGWKLLDKNRFGASLRDTSAETETLVIVTLTPSS